MERKTLSEIQFTNQNLHQDYQFIVFVNIHRKFEEIKKRGFISVQIIILEMKVANMKPK